MKKKKWKIPFAYLHEQFSGADAIYRSARSVVEDGDFTLGKKLSEFEEHFANKIGVKYAIGVASGTDALYLVLKAKGIGPGDEVITQPNSFIATAASISLVGATPVFVDVRDDYTIDPNLIEKAITKKTKAIIPVHLTGTPAEMNPIMKIAKAHKLFILEDVAQAAFSTYDGRYTGTFGLAGAFSLHPLKIMHVWGDGGIITTNDDVLANILHLWRNHGLSDREHVEFFAHNSRLDTFQAAVADYLLARIDGDLAKREKWAQMYDRLLSDLEPQVHIPGRYLHAKPVRRVYTNYVIQADNRNGLKAYLAEKGIRSVIQYPIPIHLQKAALHLGYKQGSFPVTERQVSRILTIPCHQFLKAEDVKFVSRVIHDFYRKQVIRKKHPVKN